ncbi:MAG: hypothetical protein OXB84_07275 [Halobacteriovoraceae bacterium]|nr:hypothetical protein [Halobacteriovoraceae bacterium]
MKKTVFLCLLLICAGCSKDISSTATLKTSDCENNPEKKAPPAENLFQQADGGCKLDE